MAGCPPVPRHFCALAVLALMTAPAMAAPLSDEASRAGIVAHKALYDVSLVSTRNDSQIINISGKMFFQWQPSCDGWITDHRFTLSYDYADNPPMVVSSDFSTFETYDGKTLGFSSRRKKDGEIYEELRGKATLQKATYTIPEDLTFDFQPGTIFPTKHTTELIRHAKAGDKFFRTTIFDGSDQEGPVEINSFIGKSFAKGEKSVLHRESSFKPVAAKAIDESLLGPGWKVRMAFFPTLNPEAQSDYELTMNFHENGVISDMIIEYGDFSVSQKLVALEKLPADSCRH